MKKYKNIDVLQCMLALLCFNVWCTECFLGTREAQHHHHRIVIIPGPATSRSFSCRTGIVSVSTRTTSFEYEIIDRSDVIEEDQRGRSSILSLVVQAFGFPSTAQARKACRWGEIVILRHEGNQGNDPDDDTVMFDVTAFDESSRVVVEEHDRTTAVVVADPLSVVLPGDRLARIARRCKPPTIDGNGVKRGCYPQSLTGYVQPPIVTTGTPNDWPTVVYEDDYMAIVDKPEGLDTIGIPRQNDLQSILPFILYPPPISLSVTTIAGSLPRPVYNLDRCVRGLVVVTKDTDRTFMATSQKASAQRTTNGIQKTYTALVYGLVSQKSGTIDDPVAGQPAVSHWRVLERHTSARTSFTLLEVRTQTERTNQIRRHLSCGLGHPIVGDNTYSDGGPFLCVNVITVSHPVTGETVSCSIPIPEKFRGIVLKANDPSSSDSQDISNVLSSNLPQREISYHVQQAKLELGKKFTTNEGVDCRGEPPIDPSRMINPNQGDSEWIDDFLENI